MTWWAMSARTQEARTPGPRSYCKRNVILPVRIKVDPVEILANAAHLWVRLPHAPRHHCTAAQVEIESKT